MSVIYKRVVDLLEAEIHDELVALEPQAGTCFGFNAVAASVWRLLETPKSFDDLCADLIARYDVSDTQCADELKELLADMVQEGLVATVAA